MQRRRPLLALLAALALAAGLPACGGSSSPSGPVAEPSGSPAEDAAQERSDPAGIGSGFMDDGVGDDQGGSVPGTKRPRTSLGVG